MSMTRREAAIKSCEDRIRHLESVPPHYYGKRQRGRAIELEKVKIKALRPVSREQVEKAWRAHWIRCEDAQEGVVKYVCSHCFDYHAFREDFGEYTYNGNHPFCRKCGKAMTDEAVEMVMERLEALNDGKGD